MSFSASVSLLDAPFIHRGGLGADRDALPDRGAGAQKPCRRFVDDHGSRPIGKQVMGEKPAGRHPDAECPEVIGIDCRGIEHDAIVRVFSFPGQVVDPPLFDPGRQGSGHAEDLGIGKQGIPYDIFRAG